VCRARAIGLRPVQAPATLINGAGEEAVTARQIVEVRYLHCGGLHSSAEGHLGMEHDLTHPGAASGRELSIPPVLSR